VHVLAAAAGPVVEPAGELVQGSQYLGAVLAGQDVLRRPVNLRWSNEPWARVLNGPEPGCLWGGALFTPNYAPAYDYDLAFDYAYDYGRHMTVI